MLAEQEMFINKDFVGIAVSGEVDPAKAKTIARQFVNLAYLYPQHNILVDLRDIRASISFTDCMEISKEITGHLPDFINKVAHLICDESERICIARQLESCMVLKGFTYKVFTDSKAATGWLSKAA